MSSDAVLTIVFITKGWVTYILSKQYRQMINLAIIREKNLLMHIDTL